MNKTTVIQKNYYGSSRGGYNGGYGGSNYNRGYNGGGYGGGMGGGAGLGTALLGGAVGGLAGAAVYDALTDDKPAQTQTTTQQAVDNTPQVAQNVTPQEAATEELLPAPEVVPPPYVLPQDAPLMMAPQFYDGKRQ